MTDHDHFLDHVHNVCEIFSKDTTSLTPSRVEELYSQLDPKIDNLKHRQSVDKCKTDIHHIIESRAQEITSNNKEDIRKQSVKYNRQYKHARDEKFQENNLKKWRASQVETDRAIEYRESGELVKDVIKILSSSQ